MFFYKSIAVTTYKWIISNLTNLSLSLSLSHRHMNLFFYKYKERGATLGFPKRSPILALP